MYKEQNIQVSRADTRRVVDIILRDSVLNLLLFSSHVRFLNLLLALLCSCVMKTPSFIPLHNKVSQSNSTLQLKPPTPYLESADGVESKLKVLPEYVNLNCGAHISPK